MARELNHVAADPHKRPSPAFKHVGESPLSPRGLQASSTGTRSPRPSARSLWRLPGLRSAWICVAGEGLVEAMLRAVVLPWDFLARVQLTETHFLFSARRHVLKMFRICCP